MSTSSIASRRADPARMFRRRREVCGTWVAVMTHRRRDRGVRPAEWRTRCLRSGEIHEFIVCQPPDDPDAVIDEVCYLGFAEISRGGVVVLGDELWCGDRLIGVVHGFDETHMPNHYNILVRSPDPQTGADLALQIAGPIVFRASPAADGRA
ncbi:DUF6917 domain-containing protein [Mangrovihabitans endophyticus]|uniref:DUF6917 domain-containing protein n=1 Tax=Mangrovihabitans endophyticus TaxID=1751298 RepID=A0A8J3BSW2_9ACTN|nr:hypothetical protein [Mangrovihabitans endophyticus]GGK75322.1 hypothetical protein GCM10012284_06610 [Mangrovihabitans endophyticus]